MLKFSLAQNKKFVRRFSDKIMEHNEHKQIMAIDMLSKGDKNLPPVGIEPTTPGLRDQCSTTELKRRLQGVGPDCRQRSYCIEGQRGRVV